MNTSASLRVAALLLAFAIVSTTRGQEPPDGPPPGPGGPGGPGELGGPGGPMGPGGPGGPRSTPYTLSGVYTLEGGTANSRTKPIRPPPMMCPPSM